MAMQKYSRGSFTHSIKRADEAQHDTQFQVNTTCQQNFKLNVFVHHLAQERERAKNLFLILKQMC